MQRREPETLQRLFFEQQLIRLEGVGTELERSLEGGHRSDREMSIALLNENIERWRQELIALGEDARRELEFAVQAVLTGRQDWAVPGLDAHVPAGRGAAAMRDEPTRRAAMEMRSLETRAQMLRNRINQYRVEVHKKFAIPFACIVFVLIGAPLAVRFPRGGVGMVIAVSLTIFSIYYVSLIGGESLGDRGYVPPFWAMWTSNVVFFALAIWALTRLGREDSSARAGGWAELWARLSERLPGRRARSVLLSPAGSGGD
jgi:lipopolysaccharide export system permease protein